MKNKLKVKGLSAHGLGEVNWSKHPSISKLELTLAAAIVKMVNQRYYEFAQEFGSWDVAEFMLDNLKKDYPGLDFQFIERKNGEQYGHFILNL